LIVFPNRVAGPEPEFEVLLAIEDVEIIDSPPCYDSPFADVDCACAAGSPIAISRLTINFDCVSGDFGVVELFNPVLPSPIAHAAAPVNGNPSRTD
jgi:hypothetical protein